MSTLPGETATHDLAHIGAGLIAGLDSAVAAHDLERTDETAAAVSLLHDLVAALAPETSDHKPHGQFGTSLSLEAALAEYRRALDAALEHAQPEIVDTAGTLPIRSPGRVAPTQQLLFVHYARLRRQAERSSGALRAVLEPLVEAALHCTMTRLMQRLARTRPHAISSALTDAVRLKLVGIGGGTWTVYPSPLEGPTLYRGSSCVSSTTVSASTADFVDVLFTPRRVHGADPRIEVLGNAALGTRVLAAMQQH